MLSRTADHLFWMSRYTERAENAAESEVSPQHSQRAQHARGSLPGEEKC
ncbi:alpha-E domain-containing protein [Acidovorax sp. Root402]|nr:alpha-E domain-containing protein [Acidovorax sp. Root402]